MVSKKKEFEKLKSVQVIGYNIGGYVLIGNARGAFKFNENTKYLYDIVVKSGCINWIK